MTSDLIQCERVFCEGGAQAFRADNIHVCMSQPDLFDYHSYVRYFFTVLSGIELSLQMLGDLKVGIDSVLDLGAPSLMPFPYCSNSGLARRASLDKDCGAGANKNTEK